MNFKHRNSLPLSLALALCASVWGQSPLPLFQPAPTPTAARAANPFALREGFVKVDWRAFSGASSPGEVARILNLNLFADASFLAERTRLNWLGPNRFDWVGKIGDDDVNFSVRDGFIHGGVQRLGRTFEIESVDRYSSRIVEVNERAFAELERANPVDVEGPVEAIPETPRYPGQPDPIIDVMVLINSDVFAEIPNKEAFVASLFTLSNQAYVNSAIGQTIRLVHWQEMTTGIVGRENLSWMKTNAAVTALRDQYGADMVHMVLKTHDAAGTSSGDYSISTRSAAFGNKTFPHELGHGMGAQHAWEQYTNPTGYNYGYINHAKSWRTIMSYAECNNGGSCTRVAWFSNPDVMYNGDPAGIADSRDNARMMRSRSVAMSNRKPTKVPVDIRKRVIVDPPASFSIQGLGRGRLDLQVTRGERLSIGFHSLAGQWVEVADKEFLPGEHKVTWKPEALAPGVQILQIRGRSVQKAVKLTVMR